MTEVISNIAFGIVLYNEALQKSVSYLTLCESIDRHYTDGGPKVLIVVFDNTPRESDDILAVPPFANDRIEVVFLAENRNMGLPYAYNAIGAAVKQKSKEWLVLLDQDTKLPLDFFSVYSGADARFEVFCPIIKSGSSVISPVRYRNFRGYPLNIPASHSLPFQEVTCINSGLMVRMDTFLRVGGYNEDLFLDFCDHDFMHRLKKHKINTLGILDLRLEQDFSNDTHDEQQALARYAIFVRDLKAFAKDKNRFKILLYVDLARLAGLMLKFKSLAFAKMRLRYTRK